MNLRNLLSYHLNNIYLGKSNQAARKGTGPLKLASQKSNKENAIHAQKKHTEQKYAEYIHLRQNYDS